MSSRCCSGCPAPTLTLPQWLTRPSPALRFAGSACAGALLGMAVGWCVNAAMVEISINSIFAAYFGLFFCALAGVIAVRVSAFSAGAHRPALLVLAALMGASGLLCLAYQRHWFFSLAGGARVPIYALIGVSLAFALTFATAELLNYAAGGGSGLGGGGGGGGEPGGAARARAALVQTPTQVILLAVASVLLGLVYGLMFGSAEIGRGVFTLHTLRTQFIHEERIALPVGAAIGAVTGYLNERWRAADAGGGDKDEESRGIGGFGAEEQQARKLGADDTAELDASVDDAFRRNV